ncbi:MAG: VRR-NUC domain-containing protein [Sulfurovum sp.]|nr:VRR-NUC domain-containing protein [Sulfurovum sp.]
MIIPKEIDEQRTFIDWLKRKRIPFAAVPNGQKRTRWQAQQAKKEGMTAGVSDLFVFTPKKIVFVEMKRRKKSVSRVSERQREFLKMVNQFEYALGVVCYGAQEAIETIEEMI